MHELGHALGLAPGHSMSGDIMYGSVRKTLSTNDAEAAKAAYHGHTAH